MARNRGIQISTSRFACLKIDDDEDNVKETSNSKSNSQQSQREINAAKKRAKNKKAKKEAEQLKQMAFGGGKNSGGGKKAQQHPQQKPQTNGNDGAGDQSNFNKWAEHDKEQVDEQFKNDLAKAILQSKLEDEKALQEKKQQKERVEAGLEPPASRDGRKKKKQKGKPQAMSLEQFKQLPQEKPPNSSDESDGDDSQPPALQTRVPATQHDPKFFNDVKDDAETILRQEKMQEDFRKHYASDNVVVSKLKNDLELKDLRIGQLTEKMNTMEAELKQVKKRNKQLCVILAQGEMKDKATVLMQVEELTNVREELTDQVTSLTGDLEKEKSKNRALKAEMEKLKNNKHK